MTLLYSRHSALLRACATSAQIRQLSAYTATTEFHCSQLPGQKAHLTPPPGWDGSPGTPSGLFSVPTTHLLGPSPGFPQASPLRYKVLHLIPAVRSSSSKRCPPLPFISKTSSPKLSIRHLFHFIIMQGGCKLDAQGSYKGVAQLLIRKCPSLM